MDPTIRMTGETARRDFIAFLLADGETAGEVDRAALDRSLAQGRGSYADLADAGVLPAARLAAAIARFHGLPSVGDAALVVEPQLFGSLSVRFLRRSGLFPFRKDGRILIAAGDPTRADDIEAVRLALETPAPVVVASLAAISQRLDDLAGKGPSSSEERAAVPASEDDQRDVERLQDLASGAPIVLALNDLLETAMRLAATDIHVEMEAEGARVRMRVDGLLRGQGRLGASVARGVISRMKILSGLNIAERRLPQDGRARVSISDADVDIRVATAPTLHGESLVLRLLPREAFALDLSRLGMRESDLARFTACLREPHGLIAVTGPTGSGKTTTLTAALSLLNTPERKILTIEDPIEYQIPGINQTQVKPQIALTFASALRSFLRHDPDVLMVGEMRDEETAAVGVQAALTGHLVLTTLHTNGAAEAVIRLTDLAIEPFLLNSALRCVVGQRLVRRLCPHCSRPEETIPEAAADLLAAGRVTISGSPAFRGPAGCGECGDTGYRGRIGIFEVLVVDEAVRQLIRSGASSQEIAAAAARTGMTPMLQDGFEKAAAGITGIDEVIEVCA